MTGTPRVDVVVACHDLSRPIERAVHSILLDPRSEPLARVTVVAHGLPASTIEERLSGIPGSWRVVEFSDGVRSAAGPFNFGLSLADADYCAVMGSDDFLESGALRHWLVRADAGGADAVLAPIRIDGLPVMPNPLPRLGRSTRLDAAKDRLFYRTAPLGLIRTASMRRMGLRMIEGVRVGEDFEFGIRLFSLSDRIDLAEGSPCYVIGTDARERTTLAPMRLEEDLAAVTRLLDERIPYELPPTHRRALVVKLIRVSILGKATSRPRADDWADDAEVRFLRDLLGRMLAVHPRALSVFNLQDRSVLDALANEATRANISVAVARATRAGRYRRWMTRNPIYAFGRESTLRRYVLYTLRRQRSSRE